jgi:hypothetical protein
MRIRLAGGVLLTLLLPALSGAQLPPEPDKPKTKLEAFVAQDGVVVIRGFSKIGEIRGQFGSSVVVESKEFTNAASGKREHGITVQVKEAGRLERDHTSYVDFDEIPSLIKGLEYIGKVDKSSTTLDQFQADYRTKGDLVVSTFNDASGSKVSVAVSSGVIGRTNAYLALADLARIRELVQTAYSSLEKLRASSK